MQAGETGGGTGRLSPDERRVFLILAGMLTIGGAIGALFSTHLLLILQGRGLDTCSIATHDGRCEGAVCRPRTAARHSFGRFAATQAPPAARTCQAPPRRHVPLPSALRDAR